MVEETLPRPPVRGAIAAEGFRFCQSNQAVDDVEGAAAEGDDALQRVA